MYVINIYFEQVACCGEKKIDKIIFAVIKRAIGSRPLFQPIIDIIVIINWITAVKCFQVILPWDYLLQVMAEVKAQLQRYHFTTDLWIY